MLISIFFMFQEVYFCTVLFDFNFYVLYVPGSLLLYCSLWLLFLCSLCSRKFIFVLFFIIVISMFSMFQEVYFVLFSMIVISMFFMYQEVFFVLFFMILISMFFMFQEVYCCTILYDCNFYVLYVPGSSFLYCSLWL